MTTSETTPESTALRAAPPLPAFQRFLEVAVGLDFWTTREDDVKNHRLDDWLIREAAAYATLANIHENGEFRLSRMASAAESLGEIANEEKRRAAEAYVRTLVGDEGQVEWLRALEAAASPPRVDGTTALTEQLGRETSLDAGLPRKEGRDGQP